MSNIKMKVNAPDKLCLEGVVYTIGNAIANMKGEKKKETLAAAYKLTETAYEEYKDGVNVYLVKCEGYDFHDAEYGFDSIEGIYDDFEKAKDYVENFVYEEDTSCDEVWLSIYKMKTNAILKDVPTSVYDRLVFKG